jgi:hypothetical protein
MRTIEMPEFDTDEECTQWLNEQGELGARSADWKEITDYALEVFDEQLIAFGLEVVMIETGGDYMWKIEKRVEAERGFGEIR